MTANSKIGTVREIAAVIADLRTREKKKIVHCHGVFDLLHIGHIRYMEQARTMGDVLVVTLTPDRYVDKGPHRPAFAESLRAEAVASLTCVDYVAINEWPTAEETLRILRPDVYVKGSEFRDTASDKTGKIAAEERVTKEIGAELAFTEEIVFSSTNLINRYLSTLPDEINQYLMVFRQRFTLDKILDVLDRMETLNVLVVGDAILDDYQYCQAIGKSSKDPVLAMKYQSSDLFVGGALAVANHVAGFAGKVDLVTLLGERDSYEEFIRSHLHEKVSPRFLVQPGAPTIVKRRIIDGYSINKLLEIYIMDSSGLPEEKDRELCDWMKERLHAYDLVIAADFGHGAISNQLAVILAEHAKSLAVNTQANAGNRGFHTIARYPRANYVCIAEHEIRLEMRDSTGPLKPMIQSLVKRTGTDLFVVTRGRNGCVVSDAEGQFVAVPSFAQNVVDRVGAGDAFLSVTALAAAQGVNQEVLGFIGNAAGGLAVGTIGNLKPVDKRNLQKYVTSLMK
ncbi:MAG: adenylyltransferase/cytidyltransferase family protein [Desulfomonile tiedjei]|nr:adenylyltransferase/cytidyltransferase family protein [Desulfomonile tiedjei]